MRLLSKHLQYVCAAATAPLLSHVNSQSKEIRPDLSVDDAVRA